MKCIGVLALDFVRLHVGIDKPSFASSCSKLKPDIPHLLAPTGALIVTEVYYILYVRSHFLLF